MNNSKKFTFQKWLIIFLMPLALLWLGCTDEANTPNETNKTQREAGIKSPANGSSFSKGEDIPFQLSKTDLDMQGIDLYLDRRKIDIHQGDMLPELSVGEHKLRLDINNKTVDEVTFTVKKLPDESMEYTFRFKFSYLNANDDGLYPSACLPKKGIQTRLTKQDDSEWKDFLPNIFTMSKEWNALTTSWQEGREEYGPPPCLLNRDKAHANEVFIDFYIKANKSKYLSKPIWINFESRRGGFGSRAGLLIRSISEMREILGISGSIPRSYRIDFSKNSILTLKGFGAPSVYVASGCNIYSIYDNLTAIYEWNNKLYVMTKAVTEEIVYPEGDCDAELDGFGVILILDYAKDLPLEFIEIP